MITDGRAVSAESPVTFSQTKHKIIHREVTGYQLSPDFSLRPTFLCHKMHIEKKNRKYFLAREPESFQKLFFAAEGFSVLNSVASFLLPQPQTFHWKYLLKQRMSLSFYINHQSLHQWRMQVLCC